MFLRQSPEQLYKSSLHPPLTLFFVTKMLLENSTYAHICVQLWLVTQQILCAIKMIHLSATETWLQCSGNLLD